MQTDPPRRQSSSAGSNVGIPGIGGSGGTTGVPSPGGSGGTGTGGSGAGAYSGERPPSDGTKNTNYTEPRQDPQCFQRLQAAGATATFTGFNQAQANAGGRRCFVATAVTVSKWSSTTMGGPVSNMNCPLAEKVDKWLKGIGATNMTHYGSYGCRAMRGGPSSTGLSMHGYGDAFDVASMNGQKFSNWNSAPSMQQTAWQAACGIFDRVLGPGYYAGKFVHFHVEQGHGGSCNR
jgi:hypothetical protein